MSHGNAGPLGRCGVGLACCVSLLLSGCVATGPDGVLSAAKARPDSVHDEAAVLGVISDVEGTILAEATVHLSELDIFGTVYDDGSYLFYPIPAGAYTLTVEDSRHVPATEHVDVPPGTDVYLDFVLVPVRAQGAWQRVTELAGYLDCSVMAGWDVRPAARGTLAMADGAVRNTTGPDPYTRDRLASGWAGQAACSTVDVAAANTTNDRFLHRFQLEPGVTNLVFETVWDAASPASEELTMYVEIDGFPDRDPGQYYRGAHTSPSRVFFEHTAWAWMDQRFSEACAQERPEYCGYDLVRGGVPMMARVFPAWGCVDPHAGACAVTDQPFTHLVSEFYDALAPAGWTAVEGP